MSSTAEGMTDKTYIAKSRIHGQGLFAREAIAKGEVIGWLQGEPCEEDGSYVLWLTETEGFRVTCHLRFINHSTSPNACYYDDLSVVAVRHIAANEEITHDYESAEW